MPVLRIDVVTLFPGLFEPALAAGVLGRAVERGIVAVDLHDLREHGIGRHRQVDDTPYGGGAGMVLRPEPLAAALESIRAYLKPLSEPAYRSTGGVLHPRLWSGQDPSDGRGRATFAEFLSALVVLPRRPRLEVISPFVEEGEETGPLLDLIEALQPEEVRILLPRDAEGAPRVSRATYDRIRALPA